MEQPILEAIREEIKATVNGKIDKLDKKIDEHNKKHEADMARLMPVILAYEFSERRVQDAKISGRFILVVTSFIAAVGGAWLILKHIWPGI